MAMIDDMQMEDIVCVSERVVNHEINETTSVNW